MRLVWCKTQYVGFHQWIGAPDSVAYLRQRHRHLFKVYVEVFVAGADREVEFHTLKKDVDGYLTAHISRVNTPQSCEHIAEDIAKFLFDQKYRVSEVDVSEDGECGGKVIYGE